MTSSQFGCELLKAAAKINMVSVPYKTSAAALLSVIAGESQVEVSVMQGSMPYVRSEKLRPLAITGAARSAQLPDIPTVTEAGYPGADYFSWNGVHVTAGTAPALVAKLNAELVRILKMTEVKERMLSLGLEPEGNTPEEFAAFVKADIARWREAVKIIGTQTQ
jgi:tripartite-type tricarboxylate transporter receptor subunit TctC